MRVLFVEARLAWLNLVKHRRRSGLLGAAIAAITCLFVLLSALSGGINDTVFQSAVTLAAGHLNVGGYYKISPSQAFPLLTSYEKIADIVKRLPEVDYIVQRGRGGGRIVADTASLQSGLVGIEPSAEPALRKQLVIEQGRFDDLAQPNTVMLFQHQAQTLKVGVGDAVTIVGQTVRGISNTIDCRIVAVAKDIGLLSSFSVFMSAESLRGLLRLRADATGVLQVHVKPRYIDELPRIAAELRGLLEAAGYPVLKADPRAFFEKLEDVTGASWTGQKLDVSTWQDEVSFLQASSLALKTLSSLLIGLLLGVTVAGIMNSFWISTRERTREIGTLRAIGMQRRSVARMFLLEAGLLGFLASSVGAACGFGTAAIVNQAQVSVPLSVQLFLMRDTLSLALDWGTACLVLSVMTSSAAAAALYPSLRAARLRPASAMTHLS